MTTKQQELESALTRPKEPVAPRVLRWVAVVAVLIPLVWSAAGLNLSWDRILSAPGEIWNIVHRLAPPDLSPETIQRALPKVMESLFIAWIGTMIAATISLPLSLLAARNTGGKAAGVVLRPLLSAIRTVPELVLAMFLIPVTGLGAWTGTVAIGLHSVGTLGKLSTEVIEGINPGPVEAIAGVGGGRLSRLRFGVLPQVMPTITAYWLYRFEINLRASAVIGLVGAGGIGLELREQLFFRNYARVGTVLLLTIVVVLVIDAISARLRRRIITGLREPGPVAVFLEAGWVKRGATLVGALIAAYFIGFILLQLQAPVV